MKFIPLRTIVSFHTPILATLLIMVVAVACSDPENSEAPSDGPDIGFEYAPEERNYSQQQIAFWNSIQSHCGNAYEGRIADATPHYSNIADAERIAIHVRDCTEDLIHISLHVDDDHSRNLLLTRESGTLRLKHDHRNPDGSEEVITMYGGDAPKPGLETRQIFEADDHTAEILPDRFDNFWFLDMMDEETFAYGVHWPKHGHSIRIEFNLAERVEAPPVPWGYEIR